MLEASIRRDGYDNFGPENRFGVFPSASVGWNVGKESFVKDNITWMSQLKLRGSYGKIGNNTIPQFLYEPSFTNNYLYFHMMGKIRREDSGIQMLRMLRLNGKTWPNGI